MEYPLQNLLMFSSWREVPINRNDSEIEMFTKYFKIVEKDEILRVMTNSFDEDEPKSKSVSTSFRTNGNSCYKNMAYDAALKLYNTSISRAPRDSIEFGLAIANRSAVLFDMNEYKACMADINIVLRSEYPKNLLYKVILRQSKCFLELNSFSEAMKSLKTAQEAFNKDKKNMSQAQIVIVDENIKMLNKDINEKKEKPVESEEGDNHFLLPPVLQDGENPKFVNASKAVYFKHNTQAERCVIAKSPIKTGDVLFMEKPYALTSLKRFQVCSFCLQTSVNCIPCTTCTTNFYCSIKCQQTAWNLSHRWECCNERREIITDIRQKLGLSILLKASHDGLDTKVEDTSVYGSKENNYPFMNKLLTHKNKVPKFVLSYNIKAAVWIVIYLKNFTDYFEWFYVRFNRPEGSKNDLYNIVGGHLLKCLLQIGCNWNIIQSGIVKCKYDKEISIHFTGLGLGIYLSSALLNHSCVPNAVSSFENDVKIIRAIKDIKPGTEVTIDYVRRFNDNIIERQAQLGKYFFKCTCVACTDSKYGERDEPWLCVRCQGKAYCHGDIKLLKCAHCNFVFSRKLHYRTESKIAQTVLAFKLTEDLTIKDTLYRLLKKTYHKDHLIYIDFYTGCFKIYEKLNDYKKSSEALKSLENITQNIFGDTSLPHIVTMIHCTYYYVYYSNQLKHENSVLYEKCVTETKKYMEKSVKYLQFYFASKDVKNFINDVTHILKSGEKIESADDDDDIDMEYMLKNFARVCSLFH